MQTFFVKLTAYIKNTPMILLKDTRYDKMQYGSTKYGRRFAFAWFLPQNFHSEGSDALCMSGKYKERLHMLTTEGLIAIISLCVAMFTLGYDIGRNNR
jgi:hypothetical protein